MESLVGSSLEVDSRTIDEWARVALCLSRTRHVRGKETSGIVQKLRSLRADTDEEKVRMVDTTSALVCTGRVKP